MERKDEKGFFCSVEKAIKSDDTKLKMYIKKSLFIQLCVQASKCTELPQEALLELLQRYKNGELVEKKQDAKDYVVMTNKDGKYRLMSYIQRSQEYPRHSLINSKEVRLEIHDFMTQEDAINTRKKFDRIDREQADRNPNQEYTQGRCFVGCFSGTTINARDTSFEDDTEHHEAIVNEFNQLLSK
jgi:hypothetical protein